MTDPAPLAIGTRRELFVDQYLIEEMTGGANQRLHHPTPRETVITQDYPWEEGTGTLALITILDDGLYRMYYRAVRMRDVPSEADQRFGIGDSLICYAESSDGIHWEKPELRLFEFEGSNRNNIVWKGQASAGFTPFIDNRPDCPLRRTL